MAEAFILLESERGRSALRAYFDRYVPLAVDRGVGFILESPTWRANPDWGAKIGVDRHRLAEVNRASVDLMHEIRARYETERTPLVISGCIGPRGDGYAPGPLMSPGEAEAYHGADQSVSRLWLRLRISDHYDQYQRGDRSGACGASDRHAVCDLLHARNRRTPSNWA